MGLAGDQTEIALSENPYHNVSGCERQDTKRYGTRGQYTLQGSDFRSAGITSSWAIGLFWDSEIKSVILTKMLETACLICVHYKMLTNIY